MINYFNLIDVWETIQKGYTPKMNTSTNKLSLDSKLEKMVDDYAINVILGSISESIALVFTNATNAKEMWEALINKFKGNAQIKRTKLTGLETRFETFNIGEGESIEDMYN